MCGFTYFIFVWLDSHEGGKGNKLAKWTNINLIPFTFKKNKNPKNKLACGMPLGLRIGICPEIPYP